MLQGAAFKTKVEIELFLAGRFPRTELMPLVEAVPGTRRVSNDAIALTQVGAATEQFRQPAPGHVKNANDFAKVVPTACQRFALHFSIGQGAHDKLRYAQELFSHQLRPGDLEAMFELALDQLVCVGEKRKFAATSRPQRVARKSVNSRHIPNRVKREVWKRDGGQCTFVGESGHRCESRTLVEYDHVEAIARGAMATVNGIRLRCRAHNQFTAEQTFGREFMANKREAARRATEQARAAAQPHDVANGLPRRDGRREPPCRSAANHNPRYRIFSATLFPCRNNSR